MIGERWAAELQSVKVALGVRAGLWRESGDLGAQGYAVGVMVMSTGIHRT